MKKSNIPFKSNGLKCALCGKDLSETLSGNVVFVKECDAQGLSTDKIVDVMLVSKECDSALQEACRKEHLSTTYWNELVYYKNPIIWWQHLNDFIEELTKGNYTSKAAEKMKALLWETYPFIARDLSESEEQMGRTIISI